MERLRRAVIALVMMLGALGLLSPRASADGVPSGACAASTSAGDLSKFFASGASGFLGGDTPHVFALADGRVLWLFADSFVGAPDTTDLTKAGFAHNVALVQDGRCFRVVWGGGSAAAPRAYLGGDRDERLSHWWWPLDGQLGVDGNLHVFAAEFVNANHTGAAPGATPVATWHAVIRTTDLKVLSFAPAADPATRPLYGYSVTSDDDWSYLYGNCFRQFTTPGFVGDFDRTCTTDVTVARVPRGQFDELPQYWDGREWSSDRATAAVVHHAGIFSNPLQVQRFTKNTYVAVSFLDDWFGSAVVSYRSTSPTGPFTRYARTPVRRKCDTLCTTYAAAFTSGRTAAGDFQVAISNFTWDPTVAFASPELYRPSIITVRDPSASVTRPYSFDKDGTLEVQVSGRGAGGSARAAMLGVSVPSARVDGSVTVWPCGARRPSSPTVSVAQGAAANTALVTVLGLGGRVCVWSAEHLAVRVHLQGWVAAPTTFHPVASARLVDTNSAGHTIDGRMEGAGRLHRGTTYRIPVRGRSGVPKTATSVALAVRVSGSSSRSSLKVWTCGAGAPTTNVNTAAGNSASNLVFAALDRYGQVCLQSSEASHLTVELQGWWEGSDEIRLTGRARLLDTRAGRATVDGVGRPNRRVGSTYVTRVPVVGRAGISASDAVTVNVTAIAATGRGSLSLWPCGADRSTAATMALAPGSLASLQVTMRPGDGGAWCLAASIGEKVDVAMDAVGWFPATPFGFVGSAPSTLFYGRA
jgi:hypothetical protein